MRCPECNGRVTLVVSTHWQAAGEVVRRRVCKACDHRWYSVQSAEVEVSGEQLAWSKGKALLKRGAFDP
jgi:transcriptional regulator NrdR family protein